MLASPDASLGPDLSGQIIDNLHVQRQLGSGAMGSVWLARDTELDTLVAVKVLAAQLANSPSHVQRFLREARAVASLDHPGIVRVLQAGRKAFQSGFLRVIVMEYVAGGDLRSRLQKSPGGRLEPVECAQILLQCSSALEHAHQRGVVHRDIKPANVLLDEAGAARLVDFGIARLERTELQSVLTQEGDLVGTPAYLAPEQVLGQHVDGRADIYSLGCMLYQVLSGRLPFEGSNSFEVLEGHVSGTLAFPASHFRTVPEALQELVAGMCRKAPDERLSLDEVQQRVRSFLKSLAPNTARHRTPFGRSGGDAALPLTNLQARESSFVGRERELEELTTILLQGGGGQRLITLGGPGGVGKTRLACEFGLRVMNGQRFPGGVWFCNLSEVGDLAGMCHALAKTLGIPLTAGDAVQQLGAAMALREPMLVIFDNLEQVLEPAREVLPTWLASNEGVSFLVTSREALHCDDERVYALLPLSEEVVALTGAPNAPSSAAQLFLDRAREAGRRIEPAGTSLVLVERLVRELDGIPLAIELAASRCGVMTVQQILERLPRRLDLLRGRQRDGSQRQTTMRGAIDWSWRLLAPWEQDALAQCAIFQGGFLLEHAEAVVDLKHHADAPFVMDVVESLVEKSLLTSSALQGLPGENRFRMLETIRAYAAEKLAEHPDDRKCELRERFATHMAAYAEKWDGELHGPKCREVLLRIELEHDNLRGVQELRKEFPVQAARAAFASSMTIRLRGPWAGRIASLEGALHCLPPAEHTTLRLKLAGAWALAAYDIGERDTVEQAVEVMTSALQELGHQTKLEDRLTWLIGNHLRHIVNNRYLDASNEADVFFASIDWKPGQNSEDRSRFKVSERRLIAKFMSDLGNVLQHQGLYDRAQTCFEDVVACCRELQDPIGVEAGLSNLGNVCHLARDLQRAKDCYLKAESISRSIGLSAGVARNLGNRVSVLTEMRGWDEALACLDEADAINRELGREVALAINYGNRGTVLRGLGRYDEALEYLHRAEVMSRSRQRFTHVAYWVNSQARVLMQQAQGCDSNQAHALLERALGLAEEGYRIRLELGARLEPSWFSTLDVLAYLHYLLGHREQAREFALQAEAAGKQLRIERLERQGPNAGKVLENWVRIEEVLAATAATGTE